MSISKIKVGSTEHDLQASTVVRNVTDNTDVNIWKVQEHSILIRGL